jgi:adenosylcobinamide-GDP ribazoletransferase
MTDVAVRPGPATRGGPFAELLAAVSFLTRVPVRSRADGSPRAGAAAFGLVGAAIGAVAALPLLLAGAAHPLPAAIAAIAILAVLDGALHLDGLSDTFDALAAPAGAADRARTDPRAGTAGVVAIVVALGLDAAALAELAARGTLIGVAALIAAVTVSRAVAPAWAVVVGRRLRVPDGGLGSWFADRTSPVAAVVALVTAVVVTLLLVEFTGPLVALAVGAGTVVGTLLAGWLIALRGQLDGDGYGAIIETTLAAILLAAVVLG